MKTISPESRARAEKFRLHALNLALAGVLAARRPDNDGEMKQATNNLLDAIARDFDAIQKEKK